MLGLGVRMLGMGVRMLGMGVRGRFFYVSAKVLGAGVAPRSPPLFGMGSAGFQDE